MEVEQKGTAIVCLVISELGAIGLLVVPKSFHLFMFLPPNCRHTPRYIASSPPVIVLLDSVE